MKFNPRQRWVVLGGLLTATLAAAAWVHDRDEGGVLVVARAVDQGDRSVGTQRSANDQPLRIAQSSGAASSSRSESSQSVPQVRLDKLDERHLGSASKDPFAVPRRALKKRMPPKPAPVVVARSAPPPPPKAPPLPFTYMGKMMAGDTVSVFLIHGNRNLVVHEGDTIDSKYRVDRIGETAMALTYLPLDQRQTLNFGERR